MAGEGDYSVGFAATSSSSYRVAYNASGENRVTQAVRHFSRPVIVVPHSIAFPRWETRRILLAIARTG